jgi:hypothetical protein
MARRVSSRTGRGMDGAKQNSGPPHPHRPSEDWHRATRAEGESGPAAATPLPESGNSEVPHMFAFSAQPR